MQTVEKIYPTSIMISGGELGMRDDVFEIKMRLKGICDNISVFIKGTFIERFLKDILKNGWKI